LHSNYPTNRSRRFRRREASGHRPPGGLCAKIGSCPRSHRLGKAHKEPVSVRHSHLRQCLRVYRVVFTNQLIQSLLRHCHPWSAATRSPTSRLPRRGSPISGPTRVPTHLGRSPQLSRRAASGHDGLKAFRRGFRSTSTTRKATCCPPQCVPCRNLGDVVSNQPGSQYAFLNRDQARTGGRRPA
jgi:hypothetical protein